MRFNNKKGFTLVELLVVMAVIIILTSLVLTLIPYITKKQARTHATAEIKALESALENYKADNGIYPNDAVMGAGTYSSGDTDKLVAQTMGDPTQSAYTKASLVLYRALSGDRNLDRTLNSSDQSFDINGTSLGTTLPAVPTEYYHFDSTLVLPSGGSGTITNMVDGFGFNFGYSTVYQADVANGISTPRGYNPTYDLWSTAGVITTGTVSDTTTVQKQWITNWPVPGGQQ